MAADGDNRHKSDIGAEHPSQHRINDALLKRLDAAKKSRHRATKERLLHDPRVSELINELLLSNEAWIATVIAQNIRRQPHLRGCSVEELYSTAFVGKSAEEGTVSGVMSAILEYDYPRFGTAAFTRYLAQAIHHALQPTPKQQRTYRRVYAKMQSMHGSDEDEANPGWVDRTTRPPPAVATDHELLEVVKSVIPRLPKPRQRATAAWMVEHILATGERPTLQEIARVQRPHVTHQRASQIIEETVNSLGRQIEADYPQLAADGVGGWEEFKKVFTRVSPGRQPSRI